MFDEDIEPLIAKAQVVIDATTQHVHYACHLKMTIEGSLCYATQTY